MSRLIKYFCDRCGKECKTLASVNIPVEKLSGGTLRTSPLDMCEQCENQADAIFDNCIDIKIMMFDKFMKREGEGK